MNRLQKFLLLLVTALALFVSVYTTASAQDPYNVGPQRVGTFSIFGNSDAVQLTVKGGVTQTANLMSVMTRDGTNRMSLSSAGVATLAGNVSAPTYTSGDGSATTPAYGNTVDTNTGVWFPAADQLGFTTGGTSRLTLSTTSLSSTVPYVSGNGSAAAPAFAPGSLDMGMYKAATDTLGFATNGSVRATFDTDSLDFASGTGVNLNAGDLKVIGKIGANTVPTSYFHTVRDTFSSANGFGLRIQDTDTAADATNILMQADMASDNDATGAYVLEIQDSGGQIGSIKYASATGVSFNTTSDARLKTDVRPMTDGIARLKTISPKYYKWIENGSEGEGFIAQELKKVVPDAVSGDPGDDVKTSPMSVDYGRLTPVLTAALKELVDRVETLEAELAELKK